MKYESNILERLIKTYGVVGNPKYVSEIIKQFIIQGKECYHNLFTYQSDWLAHIDEFGLANDYVVTYTGQRFYAPNTKESPVKRAILKGVTKYRDKDTGEILEAFEEGRNLELVSVRVPVLTTTGKNLFNEKYQNLSDFTYDEDGIQLKTNKRLVFQNPVKIQANKTYIGLIEYSGGCASRGMGFNDVNQKGLYPTYGVPVVNSSEVKVKQVKFTPTSDTYLVSIHNGFDHDGVSSPKIHKVAIFESSNINESYEPHKSNILMVNEDVTLRGIGDVEDELDCLTGECVNNIEEREFNGSENWSSNGSSNGVYKYYCNTYTDAKGNTTTSISDKVEFVNMNGGEPLKGDVCLTHTTSTGKVQFATTINTTANFKAWLKENPVVVQYERANPVTKTVGVIIKDQNNQVVNHLTSFEGGTHFDTSSQTGSVLPTLEVDVVVDLEETLMMCSTEGNTM